METVKINMVPKGAVKAAHASQGDAPRVVRFELFDEFLPYTLDGSEDITLTVVRPDKEEIVSSVTNTEEAYIDVSFTSEMTALRGVANCEIKITKSGAEIGSHNFDLNIERGAYGEDITVETAQGVIATFTTGVIDNLVGLKTTFEPKQDLHGYETPWIDSNVVNKAPYLSRALAGTASRIGNYEFNKLVGGTYAFNQLLRPFNADYYSSNRCDPSFSENSAICVCNEVGLFGIYTKSSYRFSVTDHKYFIGITFNTAQSGNFKYGLDAIGYTVSITELNQDLRLSTIQNATVNNDICTAYKRTNVSIGDTFTVKDYIIIDLTQLFGSTIADYIYNLETAQAGAGVAYFRALFDKDYYPYNVGELISVKPTAHITKDGNNTVISNTALDPDLELRGIPKLDENNKLYYDGDTYESNGDVTRKYGIVDLGSLSWSKTADGIFNTNLIGRKYGEGNFNLLCYKYVTYTGAHSTGANIEDLVSSNGNGVYVNKGSETFFIADQAYTSASDFKTAVTGIYLIYELATPTTESADPFTDPQEIDAQGSEEFIDARAVSIPVGHESYYANICEIEGIDEITFNRTGVNLYDKDNASVVTGYISASAFSDSNAKAKTICIPIKPSNTYTVSKTAGARFALAVSSVAATNGATYTTRQQDNTASHITITAGANDYYLWAWVYLEDTDTGSLEDMLGSVQIEKGDQASEYQAYDGESALVEIGQTVYGGYYDKDLGIVLTHKKIIFNGSQEIGGVNWRPKDNSIGWYYPYNLTENKLGVNSQYPSLYADRLPTETYDHLYTNDVDGVGVYNSTYAGIFIRVKDTSLDTSAKINAYLSRYPITVVYELATPIIIPADAVNFETVKGVNNVWSDTNGETEVKFYVKEA